MQKHTQTQIIAISLVFIYIAIMMFFGLDKITGYLISSSANCGNYVCETGESIFNCPDDCVATCGDYKCEEHETYTCVLDCGEARDAEVEEKAYFTGTAYMVFVLSTAMLLVGVALLGKPAKVARRISKRRPTRRKR